MAVALVASSTSGATDAQGTSRAVPVPTGAAAGLVAVLVLELWQSTATNPTVGWPAGFNEIVNYVSTTDGFQKIKAAYKVLTGADSGNYTATFTNHWNQGQCTLWSGVDTTNVLDVAISTAQNSTGTAYPSNSLTTANAGCGMLYLVANENATTPASNTAPTGYSKQQDANYLRCCTKIAGAAGSETISGGALSTSTLKLAALVALRAASGGGNSQAITPATETDSAQTPTAARSRAVTAAAETDQALPPATARTTAVTAASESDTALMPGHAKTITPAAETDTAVTPTKPGGAITPASETDTAVTPARARSTSVTPAVESDTGVTPAALRSTPTTPATETDTGIAPTRARSRAVTPAVEVDAALTPSQARAQLVAPATEVDEAIAPNNPNEVLRDLDLEAILEPARFRAVVEPNRLHARVEPARFRTEIEP